MATNLPGQIATEQLIFQQAENTSQQAITVGRSYGNEGVPLGGDYQHFNANIHLGDTSYVQQQYFQTEAFWHGTEITLPDFQGAIIDAVIKFTTNFSAASQWVIDITLLDIDGATVNSDAGINLAPVGDTRNQPSSDALEPGINIESAFKVAAFIQDDAVAVNIDNPEAQTALPSSLSEPQNTTTTSNTSRDEDTTTSNEAASEASEDAEGNPRSNQPETSSFRPDENNQPVLRIDIDNSSESSDPSEDEDNTASTQNNNQNLTDDRDVSVRNENENENENPENNDLISDDASNDGDTVENDDSGDNNDDIEDEDDTEADTEDDTGDDNDNNGDDDSGDDDISIEDDDDTEDDTGDGYDNNGNDDSGDDDISI